MDKKRFNTYKLRLINKFFEESRYVSADMCDELG